FVAGETVEKQLIIVNNSRETATADCAWALRGGAPGTAWPESFAGKSQVAVPTGQQERLPLSFALPASLAPGSYELGAEVRFNTGEAQHDSLAVHVLPRVSGRISDDGTRVALFDPRGETRALLDEIGLPYRSVDAGADLSEVDLLIVGKAALTVDGPAPRIGRVRDGLKVIVFEQTSQVLEKRLGFRATEYGLRQVFPRLSDHPVLNGIGPEHLCDWRGEATIVPPRRDYAMRPRYGPTIDWCGIPVTRVWRCGN